MSDSTTLQSQCAVQVQTDLDGNVTEREHIVAQIGALQEQLKVLEDNHALLTAMQQALGHAAQPPAAKGKRKQKTGEGAAAGRRVPRARASDEAARTAERKQGQAAVEIRGRGDGPTLRELVAAHLAATAEPRSTAEITTGLAAAHPDRSIAATVVRNTLENLVAKGQTERTRQNRSVFYTGTPATPHGTASEGEAAVTTKSGATA